MQYTKLMKKVVDKLLSYVYLDARKHFFLGGRGDAKNGRKTESTQGLGEGCLDHLRENGQKRRWEQLKIIVINPDLIGCDLASSGAPLPRETSIFML